MHIKIRCKKKEVQPAAVVHIPPTIVSGSDNRRLDLKKILPHSDRIPCVAENAAFGCTRWRSAEIYFKVVQLTRIKLLSF
jgi:hypothetical protein